jgi:hypothetical protein
VLSTTRQRPASGRRRPARIPTTGVNRAVTLPVYPTVEQAGLLVSLFAVEREVYNAALEERRGAWRCERRSVTRYEQYGTLTEATGECFALLRRLGTGVARGTLTRLDEAFSAFHRRVAEGRTPGYPRFRGPERFDSVQDEGVSGWELTETGRGTYGRLYLQGVGHLKVKIPPRRFCGGEPRSSWCDGARRVATRRRCPTATPSSSPSRQAGVPAASTGASPCSARWPTPTAP